MREWVPLRWAGRWVQAVPGSPEEWQAGSRCFQFPVFLPRCASPTASHSLLPFYLQGSPKILTLWRRSTWHIAGAGSPLPSHYGLPQLSAPLLQQPVMWPLPAGQPSVPSLLATLEGHPQCGRGLELQKGRGRGVGATDCPGERAVLGL